MKKQTVKYLPSPREATAREVRHNRFITRWGSCLEVIIIAVLLTGIAILGVMILSMLNIIPPGLF